jgi:hypothetical protein
MLELGLKSTMALSALAQAAAMQKDDALAIDYLTQVFATVSGQYPSTCNAGELRSGRRQNRAEPGVVPQGSGALLG